MHWRVPRVSLGLRAASLSLFQQGAGFKVAYTQVLGKSLEHAGAPLTLEWKMDFVQRKMEERKGHAQSRADGQADVSSARPNAFQVNIGS